MEHVGRLADLLAALPARVFPGRRTQTGADAVDGWERRLAAEMEPIKDALARMLQAAAGLGVEEGREWVEREVFGVRKDLGIDWDLPNNEAIRWALAYAVQLVTGIDQTTRARIAADVATWIANGEALGALINALEADYGFSRARAEAIAATEVTRAYAYGNQAAWRASGVVDGLQWVTANDERVCPVCAPLGGLVFNADDDEAEPASVAEQQRRGVVTGIGGGFAHPGGRGAAGRYQGQTFDLPPAHPRCRCHISPVINI